MLRGLASEEGDITVPATIVRELFTERDHLRMELATERRRANVNADLAGRHDPTGEDHMHEMMEHAQRADTAEAERDRLRTALDAAISYVFALEGQKEAVVTRSRRSYEAALAALELDDPEAIDG